MHLICVFYLTRTHFTFLNNFRSYITPYFVIRLRGERERFEWPFLFLKEHVLQSTKVYMNYFLNYNNHKRTLFSSRHNASSADGVRDIFSRTTYKPSTSNTNREDVRNNQNIVSMGLVAVLALFFVVLAIIYLGLGGKTETLPSLSSGRYAEI